MRTRPLIVASMTALLTLAAGAPAYAQSQGNGDQSVPDAPQPQKKPAAKAQSPDSGSQAKDKSKSDPQASDSSSPPKPAPNPSSKDDNPFPEAVSKEAAAKAAAESSPSGQSSDQEKANPHKSAPDDNPFPEAVSRDAAKAAGNDPDQAPPGKNDLPPGVSSSQSTPDPDSGENGAPNHVADPGRAKRDAEVGDYYLKSRDFQGAMLRYQDAATADPTNVDAIFGLAESQRMLRKNADAARNYQLYLDIVPNGPKAKQALKALKTLGSGG